MITEKAFIFSHQSFWVGVAPMISQFTRLQNLTIERFLPPFHMATDDNRGLIGELTFRVFSVAYKRSCRGTDLIESEMQLCVKNSVDFIRRFRAFSRQPMFQPSDEGVDEACQLADRLIDFFCKEKVNLKLWPQFPGCGWLDSVEGDGLGGSTLYEVKCGKSRVKGKDIKQILCYLALNYESKLYKIDRICLVNPRTGTVFRCTTDALCRGVSGTAPSVLLGDIIEYVSEPLWFLEGI